MYFNATENMLKIWIITALAAILLYECVKYLLSLLVMNKLRYSMFILFGSSIFAHYYGWWMYFNYYNDNYYSQFYHQLFFSVSNCTAFMQSLNNVLIFSFNICQLTEMICTGMVIHLAHVEHEVTIRKILLIFGISILHILAGGFDQFVSNVIRGEGRLHQVTIVMLIIQQTHWLIQQFTLQVIRDIWLMVPDLMHCIIPLILLLQARGDNFSEKPIYMDRKFRKEFIIMICMVGILFMICTLI